MTEIENKPCLVETSQGFSVKYKEKFLYSKYNPAKTITGKIETMEILPGTVFLGFSAVLPYGLSELSKKLPDNCIILLCETDKELKAFSSDFYNEKTAHTVLVSDSEMLNLPVILQKPSYTFEDGNTVEFAGNFRRVIRLDFSAGVQFHEDFYLRLEKACVSAVRQFWTNRFTLSKFGRRYSRNLFQNLQLLNETKPFSDFIRKIDRPVFVFGAGESAEQGIKDLFGFIKEKGDRPFVLCADTAFHMLKSNGIIPDGIVVDEAQSVIAQSFIGAKDVQIFQSLCSLPSVAGRNYPKKNISYYATEYASNSFFDSLKDMQFFPPVIPAFGSVGITAYVLACLFRKNEDIPVYVYGLDFAYSTGKTHGMGTPAHKRQLRSHNRIKAVENFGACFGNNVLRLPSGSPLPFSTPVLQSYADTFRGVAEQNREISENIINQYVNKRPADTFNDVKEFIENEKKCLLELRSLLTGETKVTEEIRSQKIQELLENRQYLYLHFPDGYKLNAGDISFLKRVRGEIDGFLKLMQQ